MPMALMLNTTATAKATAEVKKCSETAGVDKSSRRIEAPA